jgi:hypothetical protein
MVLEISYGNARESILSLSIRRTNSILGLWGIHYQQACPAAEMDIILKDLEHKGKSGCIWSIIIAAGS